MDIPLDGMYPLKISSPTQYIAFSFCWCLSSRCFLFWCSTIYFLFFFHLFIFAFVSLAWGNIVTKVLLRLVSKSCLHVFFRSFMVSSLTFKSLFHFVFIFVCSLSRWSSFILRHVLVQFSNTICWLNCFFLLCIFLPQLL